MSNDFLTINDFETTDNKTNCIFCKRSTKPIDAVHIPGKGYICNNCAVRIEHGLKKNRHSNEQKNTTNNSIKCMDPFEDIFNDENKKNSLSDNYPNWGDIFVPLPRDIYAKLSEYVIGQETSKKKLSIAAYNHFKRVTLQEPGISKSNILLIGPTGSGKTLLVKTLKSILGVPCVFASATSLTENGYVGSDVETTIERLLCEANDDISKAEKGIVFIDEIDKLVENGTIATSGNSVGRSGVQQALLTLIEGTDVDVRNKQGRKVTVNTSNILFIVGGAFPGIEKIIAKRLQAGNSIGFGSNVFDAKEMQEELLNKVTTDDLREYGMLSEFLGRVPCITTLHSVTIDMLEKVLIEPKDGLIWQYQQLLKYDNIDFEIERDAIRRIAELAYEEGIGCRGLRKICEELFEDIMYSLPGTNCSKVIYTANCVDGATPTIIENKQANN